MFQHWTKEAGIYNSKEKINHERQQKVEEQAEKHCIHIKST